MTPANTAELRALLEKATPGPWEHRVDGKLRRDGLLQWKVVSLGYHGEEPAILGDDEVWPVSADDARLIAALRNAAPVLLETMERLNAMPCTLTEEEQVRLAELALDEARARIAELERKQGAEL